MSAELGERVARLEARADLAEKQFAEFVVSDTSDRKLIHATLTQIDGKLTKQLSFFGGVMFTVTALWAFVVFAKDWILAHWK